MEIEKYLEEISIVNSSIGLTTREKAIIFRISRIVLSKKINDTGINCPRLKEGKCPYFRRK